MIGKTLAHYEVTALLGKGGMGEVYRARDSKLGRNVALKILPEAFAEDRERMARFEREARVLASLSHPGIASIFGLEEDQGVRFLVMELVEGEDLGYHLDRAPLSVRQTVDIALQIAEALEEAHANGIVHRDLKPANIKLSDRGRIKILDFGLAKAIADGTHDSSALADLPTMTSNMTHLGAILGTPAYMSPEQARGKIADTRSDIWAYGCVLWECLTGEKLFGAETNADSIAAILNKEPPWNRMPTRSPPNLQRLLRHCLVKDPHNRLHDIADARIELQDAVAKAAETPARESAGASRWYRWSTLGLGTVLVVVLFLFVARVSGLIGHPGKTLGAEPLIGADFTRLTDLPGDEFDAAISPDGRFVAFVSDRDGPFDVLVGQIESREFRSMTRNWKEGLLGKTGFWAPLRQIGFTGDGSELWFGGGTGQRLRIMSLLGGPLRNFLGEEVVNVEWSPDGKRIVYHSRAPGDPVFVADPSGANESLILPSAAGNHQHYPIWSRDGQWIYLVRGSPNTGEMDLWRIRPDGSDPERLTRHLRNVTYPTPLDGRIVLFCAQEPDGAGPWLWALDVETGSCVRASVGVEHYSSLSASADGRRLVATVENPQATLWRVPILDRVATGSDVVPLPLPTVRALAPRFGGDQLFYLSSRGAGDGLWRHDDGETVEIWKGAGTPLLEAPAVSPDGQSVALVLQEGEQQRLYVLSADGAELRALTDRVDVRGTGSWSPDGQWIALGGTQEGVRGLYKIPVDGGPPETIVEGEAMSPVWSPAGDRIVYMGSQVQATSPLKCVSLDGKAIEIPPIEVLREGGGGRVRFLPDGKGLVYMQGLSFSQDFFLLDLGTMKTRRLTQLDHPAMMRTFDVTPDGTEIVFDRLLRNSDIVLIELRSSASAGS